MHSIVLTILSLVINLYTGNGFNLDIRHDPAGLLSRYRGCQRYGDNILICTTLQAAIAARNEWANVKQL